MTRRQKVIPKIKEREFMAQVVELAKLRGWRIFHPFDSRHSVAGFPDLLLIRKYALIVAELKVGKRQLTQEQLGWLDAFDGASVRSYCWRPTDWPAIEKVLE
jgi:hypothetical protein